MAGCRELETQRASEHNTSSASPTPSETKLQSRFVFPAQSTPFAVASVALDSMTGQLCKTYSWEDNQNLPQGLPLCSELETGQHGPPGSGGIQTFAQWKASQKTVALGAKKAYLGFTYTFDGTIWRKGSRARQYNSQTNELEPLSEDQYDPLGLFSKEEKARTTLAKAQIQAVAHQFGVTYQDALQEAKEQGYQVPQ